MFENLPVNVVDIAFVAILIIGGATGLVLGIVRAGLFILSWLGASIATIYLLPYARPFTKPHISTPFYADLFSGIVVFLGALIVLFLISSLISGWIRNSRLSSLDRSLGMVAGLVASSIIILGTVKAFDNLILESKRPPVMQKAKSLPLVRQYANYLNKQLPETIRIPDSKSVNQAVKQTKKVLEKNIYERIIRPTITKPIEEKIKGYSEKERVILDNTFERLNSKE